MEFWIAGQFEWCGYQAVRCFRVDLRQSSAIGDSGRCVAHTQRGEDRLVEVGCKVVSGQAGDGKSHPFQAGAVHGVGARVVDERGVDDRGEFEFEARWHVLVVKIAREIGV